LFTKAELEEWNAAIDEYFEKFASGTLQSPGDKHALALVAQIDHVVIAIAIFIDKELDIWFRSKTPASTAEFFVHFCFTKAVAAIRAVKCLLDSYIGNECLPLARSLHDTVEAESGKHIPVRTSRYMAAQSPYPEDLKLYDTLYAFLSEYTHHISRPFRVIQEVMIGFIPTQT